MHEIRNNDQFGFVGQPAWHGLGIELPAGIDAVDGFRRLGIDWETRLDPIYTVSGMGEDGQPSFREVEGHRLHVRSDNGLELGMVTDNYKPMQNLELARFADAIAGEDAATILETAGTLYNNRRVFALVKLPEVVRATDDDVSEQYVLLSNGHGGHASFSVYPTSVRVVCANTLRWSERDAAKGLSFRHMGDFDSKLAAARKVLGTARKETQKFQEQVTALVNTTMTDAQARDFITLCWDQAFAVTGLEGESKDRYLARRSQQIEEMVALLENEKNALDGIRGTAWAALNAVTEFHDHSRGRFKPVRESQGRVNSNLFGASAQAKTKALRSALALI